MDGKKLLIGRRRFVGRCVVAVAIAGMAVIGTEYSPSATAVVSTSAQADIALDFTRLDTFYATFGRTKIESVLFTGAVFQASRTLNWIGQRRHASMYDLLCSSLADPRPEIQKIAYASLNDLDRVALKIHVMQIGMMSRSIKDRELSTEIRALLREIELS